MASFQSKFNAFLPNSRYIAVQVDCHAACHNFYILICQFSHILMSQKNNNAQIDGKAYNLTIQAQIFSATTAVKFPCLFFVQWKTNDQQAIAETGKYSPQKEKVSFDEIITLKTTLVYERSKQLFLKKQTQLQLNLLSRTRPDQPKLVGRVTIDLATLVNNELYTTPTEFQLQFCSVSAAITASFKVLEKIETDNSIYEVQRSMGEGISFSSNLKGITLGSHSQKSRDQISFGKDISPIGSRIIDKNIINKEMSSRCASPKPSEPGTISKQLQLRQKKQTSASTVQQSKSKEQKARTKSFSDLKITDRLENCQRKLGSVLSEQPKFNEEIVKLKGEFDVFKLESSRQKQQDDKIKRQLQGKLKDSQFVKLQLRQKQTILDQVNAQNGILKSEGTRLREEVSKLREEIVNNTIKMAQLKDNYNRVTAQLTTSEREIKRLDSANEQSSEVKKNFSQKIIQLQSQFSDSEQRCKSLQKANQQLQQIISAKDDQFTKKLEQLQSIINSNKTEREFLLSDLQTLKNELTNQTAIKNMQQSRLNTLQAQIKILTAIENQYQQAKNSWEITSTVNKEENKQKEQRIRELEDTMLSLNERIRWLEGENQLLTDNCRQNREDYNKLDQEKKIELETAQSKLNECSNTLEEERLYAASLLSQKITLQQNIAVLTSNLQSLSQDHEALTNEHVSLIGKQNQILVYWQQQKLKSKELEQLIISGNQQREREQFEAAERQKNLQIRIKELEHQLQNVNEQTTLLEEKSNMLEQQLQNRQDLILKLQDGLNSQIERTQTLNSKLITYFEKDEKMKDLTIALAEQQKRITELIEEQELAQIKNDKLLKEKETIITELVNKLENSENYGKELLLFLNQKEQQHAETLTRLNATLADFTQQLQDSQNSNEDHQLTIKQLELNIKQLRKQKDAIITANEQLDKHIKTVINNLEEEKCSMEQTLIEHQNIIAQLNQKITSKESLLLQEIQKSHEATEKLSAKEAELTQLNQLLGQRQIKISQLEKNLSQIQNQITIKNQLLEEESKRFQELQQNYDTLNNDLASFDLQQHQQQMKENIEIIQTMETQMTKLNAQVAKINSLERSLKIKTIELNSLKFKGKGQIPETDQLLKLKNQEIAALQSQKQSLIKIQKQFTILQQQVIELKQQLQLLEEERFNVQSLSNQRALWLEEAKEENKKLMEEITIIGQKHGQLEKVLFNITNSNGQNNQEGAGDIALKAENAILKEKLKEQQSLKLRISELEQIRNQLQQEIAAKEEKMEQKNNSNTANINKQSVQQSKSKNNESKSTNQPYQQLKRLLEDRSKGKMLQKMAQTVDKLLSKDNAKTFQGKTKALSKDFNKLKVQLLKLIQGKPPQQKSKMLSQIQICENGLNDIAGLL